jgi:hypothetical protein
LSGGFALDIAALEAWCGRVGLACARSDDGSQLIIPRPGEGAAPLRALAYPDRGLLSFAIRLAGEVAPARRAAVLDRVARANAVVFMGAWVLNSDLGQLYFRLTVPTRGVAYTDASVKTLVEITIGTAMASAAALADVAGLPSGL